MDFFDFINLKAQKSGANVLWCSHFPSFTKLLRLFELFLALILVFWVSNRLPLLVIVSGEFIRAIAGVIARPVFVFVVCNVIIVTLIVKSSRFSSEIPATDNAETLLYEELLRNNESYRCSKLQSSENRFSTAHSPPQVTEEIEYQDKEMIVSKIDYETAHEATENPRVYLRSKSEKLQRNDEEKENTKAKKLLRRSETAKCRNADINGESLCVEDGMSDEEFQRAIDEFIAKQLSFRREECRSMVIQNQIPVSEMKEN